MSFITTEQLQQYLTEGNNFLDTRPTEMVEAGFIQKSLIVPVNDTKVAEWIGQHLYYPVDKSVLITNGTDPIPPSVYEAIGLPTNTPIFDLSPSHAMADSPWPLDIIIPVSTTEFALDAKHDKTITVIDLASSATFHTAHYKKAIGIPWNEAAAIIQEFEPMDKLYLLSASSTIAWAVASLLRFNSFQFVRPVITTANQLAEEGLPIIRGKKA